MTDPKRPSVGESFSLPGDSYGWDVIRSVEGLSNHGEWIVRGHLRPEYPYALHEVEVNGRYQWNAIDPQASVLGEDY